MKNIVQFTCIHGNIYIYIYVYIHGICIKSEKYAPAWLEKALNSFQKSKNTCPLSL